jgi:hypothetical protein
LLSPVTQWKKISLAEMYIQNGNGQWNENPKYKNIQFCQRQIEKLYRVHDSILG